MRIATVAETVATLPAARSAYLHPTGPATHHAARSLTPTTLVDNSPTRPSPPSHPPPHHISRASPSHLPSLVSLPATLTPLATRPYLRTSRRHVRHRFDSAPTPPTPSSPRLLSISDHTADASPSRKSHLRGLSLLCACPTSTPTTTMATSRRSAKNSTAPHPPQTARDRAARAGARGR